MSIRTPSALLSQIATTLADNASGDITASLLRQNFVDLLESMERAHGWAEYTDSTYTAGSPLSVLADTETNLPNNAAGGRRTKEPTDVTLYAAGKITGKNLEARLITIDMKVKPTSVGTTLMELWFDIGGGIGPLYVRPLSFPKGNGIERQVSFTTFVYTADTWEANGATVKVQANGTAEIYDVRYVIQRNTIDFQTL